MFSNWMEFDETLLPIVQSTTSLLNLDLITLPFPVVIGHVQTRYSLRCVHILR